MKLTKTKTVVEEEVEVLSGTYLFSIGYVGDNDPYEFYKISINNEAFGKQKGYAQIDYTFVKNDSDDYFIRVKSSYDNHLPINVREFFLQDNTSEKEYITITEEEFNKQKQEVLNKLTE